MLKFVDLRQKGCFCRCLSVCWFVCLFDCYQNNSKSCGHVLMKLVMIHDFFRCIFYFYFLKGFFIATRGEMSCLRLSECCIDGVGASPAMSLTGDQLVELGVGDEPSISGCICGKKAALLSLTSAKNSSLM